MTSVSGHKIYMASCCASEVRVPIYASVNSLTVFNTPMCKCGTVKSIKDMEFLRFETPEFVPLSNGGIDNFDIQKFLK